MNIFRQALSPTTSWTTRRAIHTLPPSPLLVPSYRRETSLPPFVLQRTLPLVFPPTDGIHLKIHRPFHWSPSVSSHEPHPSPVSNSKEGIKFTVAPSGTLQDVSVLIELVTEENAQELQQVWTKAISTDFTGKDGQLLLYYSVNNESTAPQRILWVGLGKESKLSEKTIRQAASKIVDKLIELKISENIVFNLDIDYFLGLGTPLKPESIFRLLTSTITMSNYQFNKFISKEDSKKPLIKKVHFSLKPSKLHKADFNKITQLLDKAFALGQATNLARDLANERADICNPQWMQDQTYHLLGKTDKYEINVIDHHQMKVLGLNLFNAVGQGAKIPPRLIIIKYNGNPDSPGNDVALVGKGITFDTGGLNLKPTGSMEDMYLDMSGSAAVLSTMATLASLPLKLNVIGALSLAENAIGNQSYFPHSIIKSYKGLSVEIGNTDAEGRLVLADSLTFVQKHFKPSIVIDIATLTGACCVALGEYASGLWSNDASIEKLLTKAAEITDEKTWPMPLYPEYTAELKGTHSDLRSIGKGRYGGACTAAAFLKEFIEEGVKWAHLDIAGPAMTSEKRGHVPKGGTGYGVQILLNFLQQLEETNKKDTT